MFVLRTITAAVLFVCMLVPLFTPVYLQLKQLHIQHEMLEKLEKEELVSIRIKAGSLKWVKPGKPSNSLIHYKKGDCPFNTATFYAWVN